MAVINYSYQIPTLDKPVLKYVLGGWEVAGVTTIVSGDAVNPSCGTGERPQRHREHRSVADRHRLASASWCPASR